MFIYTQVFKWSYIHPVTLELLVYIPGGRVEVRKNNKQQGVWCCAGSDQQNMNGQLEMLLHPERTY